MKDILLITPPFTQLNTPYPATPYLKGFFNRKGISSYQLDLGMEVILDLFSSKQLIELFDFAFEAETIESDNAWRIYSLRNDYINSIDDTISFLQGKNSTLARYICSENFLPQASRFNQLDDMEWAFGQMGMQDKAKHLSTLFIEDLSDFIIECIDENFGFSRYAERLGESANDFTELYIALQQEATYIDKKAFAILDPIMADVSPNLVCFSVPFPGNLYSALRCAKYIKDHYPKVKIAMGGGFPNTELRSLKDERVFEFVDYITLDDGELPLELLHSLICNDDASKGLKRTFLLDEGVVSYVDSSTLADYAMRQLGAPDYSDLPLDKYISVIEMANPMHSIWCDGRWNKLTMAHGCYWANCTFCDVTLDYIGRYQPLSAALLVDRMEELIEQTGERGFHFVDEAAPPMLMKALAEEIIKRRLTVTWWTNVRFEKRFTADLCQLLAASGCIAISGGLEVASDRLLKLINKGVDVVQVAKVTRDFTQAGIMVHAYLMYGFPTQTKQETIDSLEMVRQLFEVGVIQSGFWHQFAMTAHSPVGKDPERYKVVAHEPEINFAHNDVDFTDKLGIDHTQFSFGLKKALFNYMHGVGFELPLQEWFDFNINETQIHADYIYNSIEQPDNIMTKATVQVIWLGNAPVVESFSKKKKGKVLEQFHLTFHNKKDVFSITINESEGEWLLHLLEQLHPSEGAKVLWSEIKTDFESQFYDFEMFWYSKPIMLLRENGLIVI